MFLTGLLKEGKFKSLNTKKVQMHMSHFGVGQYLFNGMVQEKDESVTKEIQMPSEIFMVYHPKGL